MEITATAQGAIDDLRKITDRYQGFTQYAKATYGNLPDIEIMVSDITGKMLLSQKISGSDVVNLNGHKAGTYIYQLTSKNGSLIKRNSFIIQ